MRKGPSLAARQDLQAQNKLWWEKNPMGYDWHRTISSQEGTPAFFAEIDHRFFQSSPFYVGARAFERLIPFDRLRGKRVLEIGCGLGAHAQLLAEAGCNLTCIDLTEKAVALTRKRLSLRGLQGDVRLMNAEEITFPDNEFDFVWSWGVIHHSASTDTIIREAYRVLKPEGEFRLMVYHRRSLTASVSVTRGMMSGKFFKGMAVPDVLSFYSDGHLARFYTRTEMMRLLTRSGFSKVHTLLLGQKSELLPIPGEGLTGRLKSFLLARFPDGLAERLLGLIGSFLFAIALKNTQKAA